MFGDFEKQTIYGTGEERILDFLAARGAGAPIYSLRTNCRNTPRIATYACLLGKLHPGYSRILRPDDGVEPEVMYYGNGANQEALLVRALETYYRAGFTGDDIVVLSPRAGPSCAAASVAAHPWRQRLRPIDQRSRGQISYSSIDAFKGLEAPVVIVTDVEEITDPQASDLFYIAVTRALHRLAILIRESAKEQVVKTLLEITTG